MLFMIGQIKLTGMGLDEIMGKVTVEAMAVSIGVSIGTAQLGAETRGDEEQGNLNYKPEDSRTSRLGTAVLALYGAVVVGSNVAPTEEITEIAVEASPLRILVMVIISLILSITVIYFSDFRGSAREKPKNMVYQVLFDACLSYLITLASSAFILWFFGRFDNVSLQIAFAQCVVLGVIASLGASAGTLSIKHAV